MTKAETTQLASLTQLVNDFREESKEDRTAIKLKVDAAITQITTVCVEQAVLKTTVDGHGTAIVNLQEGSRWQVRTTIGTLITALLAGFAAIKDMLMSR
jgi:hypothetical protein